MSESLDIEDLPRSRSKNQAAGGHLEFAFLLGIDSSDDSISQTLLFAARDYWALIDGSVWDKIRPLLIRPPRQ